MPIRQWLPTWHRGTTHGDPAQPPGAAPVAAGPQAGPDPPDDPGRSATAVRPAGLPGHHHRADRGRGRPGPPHLLPLLPDQGGGRLLGRLPAHPGRVRGHPTRPRTGPGGAAPRHRRRPGRILWAGSGAAAGADQAGVPDPGAASPAAPAAGRVGGREGRHAPPAGGGARPGELEVRALAAAVAAALFVAIEDWQAHDGQGDLGALLDRALDAGLAAPPPASRGAPPSLSSPATTTPAP